MGIFTILGLISSVMGVLEKFFDSQHAERLMGAGEARANARAMKEGRERVEKARAARRAVKHDANSVRDDPRNRD